MVMSSLLQHQAAVDVEIEIFWNSRIHYFTSVFKDAGECKIGNQEKRLVKLLKFAKETQKNLSITASNSLQTLCIKDKIFY